ncbi:1226_t:CDS:1, partial [Ambispora leptoticha]
ALQRLGGGSNTSKRTSRNKQRVYKKKRGKPSDTERGEPSDTATEKEIAPMEEEETVVETGESIKENKRKKEIERLTDLSDRMMALGHFNVYEDTWEEILRNLKREKAVPNDWMPASNDDDELILKDNDEETLSATSYPQDSSITQQLASGSDSTTQWEYKWIDNGEPADIYGPFSGLDMKAWNEQGYFLQGILVRRAGSTDEFISNINVDFSS